MNAGASVSVVRNDEIPERIASVYHAVVLSPGPGIPEEAGGMLSFIRRFAPKLPILGVCLGHQALAEQFGGRIVNLAAVCHGRSTTCTISLPDPLFEGLQSSFEVGHYHSWIVDADNCGDELEIIAKNSSGWVMALRHKYLPIRGLQFHPESVMTPQGQQIISNWVAMVNAYTYPDNNWPNDAFASAQV